MKNFTIINTVLLCIGIAICGCRTSHDKSEENNGIQIQLSLKQDPTFLSADSILSEKKIVPLETTDDNIIAQIDKLEIYNDRFYILDKRQNVIFIFNKDGHFLTKIADTGRGPNEYFHINDFHIDDNMIYLLAGGNRKIMCYDPEGKLLESFPTLHPGANITSDSAYLYLNFDFNNPQRFNVGVYSKKDHTLVKQYKFYPKQQYGMGYSHQAWTSNNNQVYAAFQYEYNIYRLMPDTCTVFATLDCGADKMYPKEWNTFSPQQKEEYDKQKGGIVNLPLVSRITSLHFTSKYLFFTFIYTSVEHTVIWNRTTQQVRYGILKPTTYYWNVMGRKLYISDQYMVLAKEAANIISYREEVPEAKEEWALDLKDDDNPCLYFYKLKI